MAHPKMANDEDDANEMLGMSAGTEVSGRDCLRPVPHNNWTASMLLCLDLKSHKVSLDWPCGT